MQSFAQGYLPAQPSGPQAPPPPPTASAPNGEYVAPLQQQTQQTYVPQSVALSGPRQIKDWNEGDPIPPGYHPVNRVRGGLIGGGAGLFGGFYLISLLIGALGTDISNACNSISTGSCSNPLWPMYIPVVGPFIAIGTAGGSATGDVFLAIDGLAQAGGVAMIIVGAIGRTVLLRNDLGAKDPLEFKVGHNESLQLKPMVGMGESRTGHGMGLALKF